MQKTQAVAALTVLQLADRHDTGEHFELRRRELRCEGTLAYGIDGGRHGGGVR